MSPTDIKTLAIELVNAAILDQNNGTLGPNVVAAMDTATTQLGYVVWEDIVEGLHNNLDEDAP